MHDVSVEDNSTDHNGWLCTMKVTKMSRLITCNMTHLQDTDNGRAVPLTADYERN